MKELGASASFNLLHLISKVGKYSKETLYEIPP